LSSSLALKSDTKQEKVGVVQITKLIKNQYTAFIHLASEISEIHSDVEELKSMFLLKYYHGKSKSMLSGVLDGIETKESNPFKLAEEEEERKSRLIKEKYKIEFSNPKSANSIGLDYPDTQPNVSSFYQPTNAMTFGNFGQPSTQTTGFLQQPTNLNLGFSAGQTTSQLSGSGMFGTSGFGSELGLTTSGLNKPTLGGFGGSGSGQGQTTPTTPAALGFGTNPSVTFGGNTQIGFGNSFGNFGQPSATIAGLDLTTSVGDSRNQKGRSKKK
jgi:hypothetical protein